MIMSLDKSGCIIPGFQVQPQPQPQVQHSTAHIEFTCPFIL